MRPLPALIVDYIRMAAHRDWHSAAALVAGFHQTLQLSSDGPVGVNTAGLAFKYLPLTGYVVLDMGTRVAFTRSHQEHDAWNDTKQARV